MTQSWREAFLSRFGPGMLGGITFGDWMKTLWRWRRRFAVAPTRWPRALAITAQSLQNSILRRYEGWRYGRELEGITVESPLFVLGHWRSGTTYLHNLLAIDRRFAFPNTYQFSFPHIFLSTEAIRARIIGFFLPSHLLGVGNQLPCPGVFSPWSDPRSPRSTCRRCCAPIAGALQSSRCRLRACAPRWKSSSGCTQRCIALSATRRGQCAAM